MSSEEPTHTPVQGTRKTIWLPQVLASAMLVYALNPENPYEYYILLRWVSGAVFAYLAFQALNRGIAGWTWILGATALVYNPIIRVSLSRGLWEIVNVVTIGIAIGLVFAFRKGTK